MRHPEISRRHLLLLGAMAPFVAACTGDPTARFAEDTADLPHTADGVAVGESQSVLYEVVLDSNPKSEHRIVFLRAVFPWPGGLRQDREVFLAYEKWEGSKGMILKAVFSANSAKLDSQQKAFELATAIMGGAAGGAALGWTMDAPKAVSNAVSSAAVSSRSAPIERIDTSDARDVRGLVESAEQVISVLAQKYPLQKNGFTIVQGAAVVSKLRGRFTIDMSKL